MERCTFANRKGTPFLIQVYKNLLILQGKNERFFVENLSLELYTFGKRENCVKMNTEGPFQIMSTVYVNGNLNF